MLYLVELKGEKRELWKKKNQSHPNTHTQRIIFIPSYGLLAGGVTGILSHQEPPKRTEQGCLQNLTVGSATGVIALGIAVTFIKYSLINQ